MSVHDRFESISGAIALGEATAEERALFAAHAPTCDACREDALDTASSPLATIAAAREREVWRPSLDRAVLARIHDRHAQRSRLTVSALGWAAGVSIAANVVFATGFAGSVSRVLVPPADAPPSIASVAIRLPAQTFARVPMRAAAVRVAAFAPMRVTHGTYHPTRHFFSRTHAPLATPQQAIDAVDPVGVADLLETNAASTSKKVALESVSPRTGPPQP